MPHTHLPISRSLPDSKRRPRSCCRVRCVISISKGCGSTSNTLLPTIRSLASSVPPVTNACTRFKALKTIFIGTHLEVSRHQRDPAPNPNPRPIPILKIYQLRKRNRNRKSWPCPCIRVRFVTRISWTHPDSNSMNRFISRGMSGVTHVSCVRPIFPLRTDSRSTYRPCTTIWWFPSVTCAIKLSPIGMSSGFIWLKFTTRCKKLDGPPGVKWSYGIIEPEENLAELRKKNVIGELFSNGFWINCPVMARTRNWVSFKLLEITQPRRDVQLLCLHCLDAPLN